ncbi:alpha/beta fold hydrolase [Yinghuangia soli]|uniref:Alpha/beta hydrolase n=1 Tax=Yinghuangia soli TaxID=2908204 RepID=A0AA41PYA2_9ACTN|nr:alpha/beta fold hydrolase [Yinghuangia soli]MCF2527906.1 alpha/beta hydrolase [Yinghuangia soli]
MIAAAFAALALLASPATAVDPGPPTAATASPAPIPAAVPVLDWQPCAAGRAWPGGAQCATARVPLDHRDPAGAALDLPLIRVPAADPGRRIGTLVLQPGGPGGSGVDFVDDNYADLPAELRERFDILGFDARGVGRSAQVRCWDDARYKKAVTEALGAPGPDGLARAVAEAEDFNAACVQASGDRLPFLGTGYVARDIDLIRAALGEERISFYGRSFGTYIGTVYADLFPGRVRAMALDGAYDPVAYAEQPYAYDLPQFLALDRAAGRLLDWCAATPAQCTFGAGDPHGAFDRLVRALDADPVAIPGRGTANGYTLVYRLMFNINGGRADWPDLAAALARAEARDPGSFLLSPPSPGSFAFLTPNVVVECTDRVYPPGEAMLAARLGAAARLAPKLGPAMAYGPPTYDHNHAPACTRWPAERPSRHTGPYTAAGSVPLLVLGTTGDPDTPYQDAVALAGRLDNARLLTFAAEGHTAFGRSVCAQEAVVRYLVDGLPPRDGTVCADEKPPAPPAASSVERRGSAPGTVAPGASAGARDGAELIGNPYRAGSRT